MDYRLSPLRRRLGFFLLLLAVNIPVYGPALDRYFDPALLRPDATIKPPRYLLDWR